MEKFKAKMMGHFPSVRVEYQECVASFPNSCSSWRGGSHIVPPTWCTGDCHEFPAHRWRHPSGSQQGCECPRGNPDFPLFAQEVRKRLALECIGCLQLLQSLLQPLTPDLRFCLAGAQHPIPGSILRVSPLYLKAALCGVVLTCRETRLTVPIRCLCPRHSSSACPSKKA